MTKRKSPIKHKVRNHSRRQGRIVVRSYLRGKHKPLPIFLHKKSTSKSPETVTLYHGTMHVFIPSIEKEGLGRKGRLTYLTDNLSEATRSFGESVVTVKIPISWFKKGFIRKSNGWYTTEKNIPKRYIEKIVVIKREKKIEGTNSKKQKTNQKICPKCGKRIPQTGWMWYCSRCKKYFTKGYDGRLSEIRYPRGP